MTQLGFITVSGLVYLATRVTKLLLESKLRKQEATLENVVIGVENYSLGRKSKNSNVKVAIAKEIEDSRVIDKVIARVEGKENRSILRSVRNLIFKLINIVL